MAYFGITFYAAYVIFKADSFLLKNQVEQTDNTEKESPTYSETVSFHAVIDAGLQCEFQKIIFNLFVFRKYR